MKRPNIFHNSAFTLIELLIVVAIIAILAAIAVPNFLEAQTRAKVSRCKADMRSLGIALESYSVDWDSYPMYPLYPYMTQEQTFHPMAGYTPVTVTTPLAYITALPVDVFFAEAKRKRVSDDPQDVQENPWAFFHYENNQHFRWWTYGHEYADGPGERIKWALVGVGPDLEGEMNEGSSINGQMGEYFMDPDISDGNPKGGQGWYDPTNGTVSLGDIVYWGPGGGFEVMYVTPPRRLIGTGG